MPFNPSQLELAMSAFGRSTIDGITYPSTGDATRSPAWSSGGGFNWWTDQRLPGSRTLRHPGGIHGGSLSGASFDDGPYQNLDHGTIGYNPAIQLAVETKCYNFFMTII